MFFRRDKKYVLSPGSQVRDEVFGLLFYSMHGPRLFFLNSGEQLDSSFFSGERTFAEWWERKRPGGAAPGDGLLRSLEQLEDKGVIRGL